MQQLLELESGNPIFWKLDIEIDKLIQECQQTTVSPVKVIEWISYDQFENIKYLSKGGCATIYTAIWKDGGYNKWNSERQILEVVTLSFTLDNSSSFLASCLGLTKDPTTQDYIDLHSGNILYFAQNDVWHISDLRLSGPVNKQLDSIYGSLPYIAPELLYVYGLGIIMWEVITGETLFRDHRFDSDFVLAIINGYRPKIFKYIPYKYATLMKQCWDANPDNRPNTTCFKAYFIEFEQLSLNDDVNNS
ncbi:hypothetical protein Glove_220g25 [Diversispora epigaea]|uniref:Protein kinase domain-containing protein n=1 Tax=Diversispora epigaea TaxID=1348612 RepID=A0A397IIC7_9GLOM|nr:hypothetical protein Glove_220g25 [Diversispora epigaea]